MSQENEHEDDVVWRSLTGPQRRLVDRAMEDVRRGDVRPNALYMVFRFDADPDDAVKAAGWFHRIERDEELRGRIRDILDGHTET